jgi:hypothetical protein
LRRSPVGSPEFPGRLSSDNPASENPVQDQSGVSRAPWFLRGLTAAILTLMALGGRTLQAQSNPNYAPPDPQYQQPYQQPQYAPQPQYQQQQPQYSPQPQYQPPQQYSAPPQYQQPQQYAQDQPYATQDPGPDDQAYGQPPTQPFAAEQLEQLVAPIALYPDNLVAQILAAATYPAQVVAADNWVHSQGYAPAEQVAYGANAQTWDPSVKALTAFPQVLDLMNHDLQWTTDLGNAYYNQPQDVLQTIQVMRQRAQDAGTLQNTPQEQVTDNQGYIQVAPVNPQVVYVPMYNPWGVYGQPIAPYPGFSLFGALGSFVGSNLVHYGLGIGIGAFSNTPFGWAGWALNWLASSIFFHQSPYYSHSTTVAHWGNGGYYGGRGGGINRTPRGLDRPVQGYNRAGNEYGRGNGYGAQAYGRQPARPQESNGYNRGFGRSGEAPYRSDASGYGHPTAQTYAYNRPQEMPARPQTYARPGGYGNGFNGAQSYAARPSAPYAGQQAYRAPAQTYQRNEYAQRAYAAPQGYSAGRSFAEPRSFAAPRQERGGGSHMFGGGHSESHFSAPKAPKAPKNSGGGGHHGGGGFFHHGK